MFESICLTYDRLVVINHTRLISITLRQSINIMNRLFVYGTLAPGKQNHDVLSEFAGEWEQATVTGTLVNEGWGSGHGCPGLIPSSEGSEIQGYLFTSSDLPENWEMLDTFEGADYKRELITVKLSGGEKVESYVYSINSPETL